MDIRVLQYFLAVCREGNFSRAAKSLHLTQPTLSRQIADLERELGCTLLERGARTITLTEKGLYLRRRAEEIVSLADQTAFDLAHDDTEVEGDVHIGAGESEGMHVVAAAIRRFRTLHPHVRFHVRSGDGLAVVEWLERGLSDFGVLISYPDIGKFAHLRLAPTDAWGALVPDDSPLAARTTIGARDLADTPLILSAQALDTGELASWFEQSGVEPQVAATYNLAFNAAQLVKEHVGYALTLDGLIATGPGTGLACPLLYPPIVSPIDVAWKRDQPLSRPAQLFLEELRTMTSERL